MSGGLKALGVVALYLLHTLFFWRSGIKLEAQAKHDQFADRDTSEYRGFGASARLTLFASTLAIHDPKGISKTTLIRTSKWYESKSARQ